MALWRSLLGIVTGAAYRQEGKQSGTPSSSSASLAVPVTLDTALQLSSAWACVKLISESVASLPVNVYRVAPDGTRTLDKSHPLSMLLNNKVNRWQTRQNFFETMTYQLVLLGNAYAMKQYDSKKRLIGLVPLMSEQMEVDLTDDGSVVYKYTDGKNVKVFSEESIWHNKLFGNGVIGLSTLSYARNSLGIAQAAETSVSKIYKNGGKPSGVLMIDKLLTKEQREAIKNNFSELAEGNNDRLFVLEAGMKYEQVSLSPQDIELLSSRRFQIEDICRFFGVPSVLVNDTSASTAWGSGIEQIIQGFYKFTLRPYLERYESSMKAWLLTPEERTTMDIEFDFNALLRPDKGERIKMAKEAVQGGLMTANEFRNEEGYAPKEGGDNLIVQQQMIPLKQIESVQRGSALNAPTN